MRTIPSEVRARVLEDHAELRKMVRELRDVARKGDVGLIRVAWTELSSFLRAHLDLEDEMFIPTLAQVDPVLADLFSGEHGSQRAWVERTDARVWDPKTPLERLIRDILDFTDDLERDMDVEEAAALNAEELPDGCFEIELPFDY